MQESHHPGPAIIQNLLSPFKGWFCTKQPLQLSVERELEQELNIHGLIHSHSNTWRSWKLPGISQVLQPCRGKHHKTSYVCCWPQEGQQPLSSSLLRAKHLLPWLSGQPNLTWLSRVSAEPLPGEQGDVVPPQGWGYSGNSWKHLFPWRIFFVISQLQVLWL